MAKKPEVKEQADTTKDSVSKEKAKTVDFAELAKKLMVENDIKTIYRTKDGYWFTKQELAKQHHAKVGGELETYNEE